MNSSALDFLQSGIGLTYGLVAYVVLAIALMTMAKKRGIENAWMAWVPILDLYLMTQIAGLEWWYLILLFIPCVNLFVAIYIWWKICEAHGKPGALSILMIFPVVNLIIPLYLAFGD
jgi:hypothetical protein